MKKYLQQLLQDLENAKTKQPEKPNYKALYPDHPAYAYGLDYIVEWENQPSYTYPQLFGIQADAFPPPEKLNSEQKTLLVTKVLELLGAFNFTFDFPEGVTKDQIYKAILDNWKIEYLTYNKEVMIELNFCLYNVEFCSWGEEHCRCKDLDDDDMMDIDINSTELPF